jgi:pyruvate formate lyase activating enzyme
MQDDDSQTILCMLEIMESFLGISGIDLIPYHRLGIPKYEGLGFPYHLEEIKPSPREKVIAIAKLFEMRGYHVRLGGI